MKVFYGLLKIPLHNNSAVALGVFDGVHRGHRVVLNEAVKRAKIIGGISIAVTFWPHPQKKESLYSLEHRLKLISEIGIDVCIVIKFNKSFSQMSAERFVEDILVRKIGARYVYVGKNFRFGSNARGDFRLLDTLSRRFGFKFKAFDLVKSGDVPISSTYIRKLIASGELNKAKRFLCNPVSILGVVIKGDALGRKLGYPTANINPCHEIIPPDGIYAVSIIYQREIMHGLCYIGTKQTLKKKPRSGVKIPKYIEVYIFNFTKNIYGEHLEVQFIKKIRDDMKFLSVNLLIEQIQKDIVMAKKVFSLH